MGNALRRIRSEARIMGCAIVPPPLPCFELIPTAFVRSIHFLGSKVNCGVLHQSQVFEMLLHRNLDYSSAPVLPGTPPYYDFAASFGLSNLDYLHRTCVQFRSRKYNHQMGADTWQQFLRDKHSSLWGIAYSHALKTSPWLGHMPTPILLWLLLASVFTTSPDWVSGSFHFSKSTYHSILQT